MPRMSLVNAVNAALLEKSKYVIVNVSVVLAPV